MLNSGHKLTVTYYGEITIEPILNPEFDVDHDFEVKNGCFQSLLLAVCGSVGVLHAVSGGCQATGACART